MTSLTLGLVGTSRKENERRVPLHPAHLPAISAELRSRLVFERGYGEPFGRPDERLAELGASLAGRAEILGEAGIVLLPKPMPADLREMREGGVLWGWPHCVQQREITQAAIDRRLTLIAWESMFTWRNGAHDLHVFHRNNEMAGYCSVVHGLGCAGLDGHYGPPLRAVVLSLGSVGRGAVRALRGLGVRDIGVYTQRPPHLVHDQVMGCTYARMVRGEDGVARVEEDGGRRSLADVLAEADVTVNCILQDTERPLTFLRDEDVPRMRPGSLVVDVSCDRGMGFDFARPTGFEDPTFQVGRLTYYAVDHSPSYFWRSASWELSRAVVPYLETVLDGPSAWERDETIARAIEVRDGVVRNDRVLAFQGRRAEYPHEVVAG